MVVDQFGTQGIRDVPDSAPVKQESLLAVGHHLCFATVTPVGIHVVVHLGPADIGFRVQVI